ncbi:hypothetical protein ACFSPU_11325 [Haoranjiania flava]|uniref:Uncharacterized protein n=1 Tax=Haoranjiania flava TaxID=1856322 RepID=A0AAE3LJG9_9BACT|nr:hypothetical protein [Haoranjiania flava]MCU7693598.1 hypothetical protein [Haoranjiania flava]
MSAANQLSLKCKLIPGQSLCAQLTFTRDRPFWFFLRQWQKEQYFHFHAKAAKERNAKKEDSSMSGKPTRQENATENIHHKHYSQNPKLKDCFYFAALRIAVTVSALTHGASLRLCKPTPYEKPCVHCCQSYHKVPGKAPNKTKRNTTFAIVLSESNPALSAFAAELCVFIG